MGLHDSALALLSTAFETCVGIAARECGGYPVGRGHLVQPVATARDVVNARLQAPSNWCYGAQADATRVEEAVGEKIMCRRAAFPTPMQSP